MILSVRITAVAFTLLVGCFHLLLTNHPAVAAEETVSEYFNLGTFNRPVSTESRPAQDWFNRGLAMCYAFNHEEGFRCFERAYEADPNCSMALWGMAYSLGPNINNLEIPSDQTLRAQTAIKLARLSAHSNQPVERSLISALETRCKVGEPDDQPQINRNYANAMRKVYQQFPNDADVAALFAESLMIQRPWGHWDKEGMPAKETPEIQQVLEAGLKNKPDHPALCHFYIHLMEMSPTPEKASDAANNLRAAMPDAGHLVHMPSHIDVHLGNYEQVISANLLAIAADKKFVEVGGRNNFYSFYRIHNYHFVVYGAMFDGQSKLALQMARAIPEQIPREMLLEQTDFLDAFLPTALHVMIRFGQWDDILEEEEPEDFLPVSRAVWHYARGLAYAAKEMIPQAEAEQKAFRKALATVPETSILFNNTSRHILGVAESMLAGEIAYRRGEFDDAFFRLRQAVRRDDSLNYDEPWGWMQPARHALGALLIEQGHFDEAEKVYRDDLKRHPENLWSLQGLSEALKEQGDTTAAEAIHSQLTIAAARADISVDRSCYCRLTGASTCCAAR